MSQLIDALSALSLIEWVIVSAVFLATHIVVYLAFAKWVYRRQWKLYQNLKRPIVVFKPTYENGSVMPGGDMANEVKLLKKNGLLNIDDSPGNFKNFNPKGKHCIVVIGYKAGMAGFAEFLRRIETNHVPLIVYTFGSNAVAGDDKKVMDKYPYALPANFPLTLLNHIFATASSYPYDTR